MRALTIKGFAQGAWRSSGFPVYGHPLCAAMECFALWVVKSRRALSQAVAPPLLKIFKIQQDEAMDYQVWI